MKKLIFLTVLLLALSLTAFAEDMKVEAEVDGYARVVWGVDLNDPVSTGFNNDAELTIELNFMKINIVDYAKGSDEDGPVYGYIKFNKILFAPQAYYYNGTYDGNARAMRGDPNMGTWDDDLIQTGDVDTISVKSIEAKIMASPFYVTIFQAPKLEFEYAEDVEAITGGGVKSGLMYAALTNAAGESAARDAHQGITVGLADLGDIVDVEFYAATPFDWNNNPGNAYALGFKVAADLGAINVPFGIETKGIGTLNYDSDEFAVAGLNEFGVGFKAYVDMLSILDMSDMFYEFKPAILFDLLMPNTDAVEPLDELGWQVGADFRFITAKDCYAEPEKDYTNDIRFRVNYSDAEDWGDLDFKLEANEDDDSGYFPDLNYAVYVLVANVLGERAYDSDLGVDIGAGAGYKVYLDADETMYVEPFGRVRYDMGFVDADADEDEIFELEIYVEFHVIANTYFKLKYESNQLLDDKVYAYDRYTYTFATATAAAMAGTPGREQDLGEITFETRIEY